MRRGPLGQGGIKTEQPGIPLTMFSSDYALEQAPPKPIWSFIKRLRRDFVHPRYWHSEKQPAVEPPCYFTPGKHPIHVYRPAALMFAAPSPVARGNTFLSEKMSA